MDASTACLQDPPAKRLKPIAYTIVIISGLYVIFTTCFVITENKNVMTVMELLTIWAAIVIVEFMAVLYRGAPHDQKSHSLVALLLTACMAAGTVFNHFLYMTVLTRLYPGDMPSWLRLDGWPSVTKGLECATWGLFLGLAMLFGAGGLRSFGKAVVWTMRVSGIFTLAGLIGPVVGNMYLYLLSTVGYSVGFLVLSVELAVLFHRKKVPV